MCLLDMVSTADRTRITELAKKYGATRVLLFGSSASAHRQSRDIGVGVQGVPASRFFRFYGELILSLSKLRFHGTLCQAYFLLSGPITG
jgi:predicted nucleotidyltransferase